ncbi:MAG: PAS domain S-box protein, partial [Terriglobales bacterium]
MLVLVPVLFELLFVAGLAVGLSRSAQELDRMEMSNIVLLRLNIIEGQIGRGMLSIARGKKTVQENLQTIDQMISVLEPKGSKSFYAERAPELQEALSEIGEMRESLGQALKKLRSVLSDPTIKEEQRMRYFPQNELLTLAMSTGNMSHRVLDLETQMRATEPQEIASLRIKIASLLCGGMAVSVAITILLARFLTLDIINRLKLIRTNAQLIAASRPLPPIMEGTDEIAQLDRVLHESNQRLDDAHRKEAAILANTVDIICSLDAKLRFQGVSAAAARVWQCRAEDLLGQSVLSLLKPETVDATRQILQKITAEPFAGTLENIVKCSDGSEKNSLWTVRWSAQDRVYYCVIHDVTELRAIENLKKQFLSMVSHDLRAPLMSTGLSLELMLTGKRGALTQQTAA